LLLIIFRNESGKIEAGERTVVTDYVPTILMLGTVVLLIVASIIPGMPSMINGIICMTVMLIGLIYSAYKKGSIKAVSSTLKDIDLNTLLLLFGLFIVVGGISEMGVVDAIANLFTHIGAGNIFLIYTVIVWMSVICSAFIDNIPYVATMLPVVQGIATTLGIDPTLLYFGLLSGATLGGNLTPIGAAANITGIGILKKAGYEVKNKDFMKIGIPFTLAAVIPAYIYFLIFYA